jgi:hypothetical protein
MKKKFFGAVVAPISIVGLTFALGLGTTAFGVGEQQQSQADSLISTLDVTTNVPVAPWCGWYVSGTLTDDLVLEPDASVSAPTEYIGTTIALTATADENTAYVGPADGRTDASASEDCSWFDDDNNKYGARYDVVANGDSFTAEALLTVEGLQTPTRDSGMDFQMTSTNPLTITNTGIELCEAGFVSTPSATLYGTGSTLTTTPWSVAKAAVTNNNFCQWAAKYDISIPEKMSPMYGNVTYRWTGPELTHTLIIPEDQTGEDTP